MVDHLCVCVRNNRITLMSLRESIQWREAERGCFPSIPFTGELEVAQSRLRKTSGLTLISCMCGPTSEKSEGLGECICCCRSRQEAALKLQWHHLPREEHFLSDIPQSTHTHTHEEMAYINNTLCMNTHKHTVSPAHMLLKTTPV